MKKRNHGLGGRAASKGIFELIDPKNHKIDNDKCASSPALSDARHVTAQQKRVVRNLEIVMYCFWALLFWLVESSP